MKNALFLLTIWVGIIVAAYAMVYWDRGIEPPLPISILASSDLRYADPGGRFSLAYPATWDLEEAEAFVHLTDPLAKIDVTVFAVEESVPETALLHALGILDSEEEDRGLLAVEEIPAPGEAERAVRIAGPVDGGLASYGLAYLYGEETIVVLVRGEETAIGARGSELDRIESGLRIPAAAAGETAPNGEAATVVEL